MILSSLVLRNAAAALVAIAMLASAHANPLIDLTPYRWQSRLLLVFVDDSANEELIDLRNSLAERACELADRDMVVGILSRRYSSKLGSQHVTAEQVRALAEELGISTERGVILVGKDGTVKLRSDSLPDLHAIFRLIDGMPMRQVEMSDSKGCP